MIILQSYPKNFMIKVMIYRRNCTNCIIYWKQKFAEAIDIFDISIQQNPDNHLSLWCKGACLRNLLLIIIYIKLLNKYEDAIIWVNKALAIDPKHVNSLHEKGRLNHSCINRLVLISLLNKYEDAITWVDKALAINPKHVYSLYEKGACL